MHIISPLICIYYSKKYADTDFLSAYFLLFMHFFLLDRTLFPSPLQITANIVCSMKSTLSNILGLNVPVIPTDTFSSLLE